MKFTAPCGHPGEPIIGTYVKCLQGCDSAKPNALAKSKPLLESFVQLRITEMEKAASDAFDRKVQDLFRQQNLDYATGKYLDDLMGLTAAGDGLKYQDHAPGWNRRYVGESDAELRERLAANDRWRQDNALARVKLIAEAVPGVKTVEVVNKGDFSGTLVRIIRATVENQRTIVADVHSALQDSPRTPVGHRFRVELATPGYLMTRAASEAHQLVYRRRRMHGESLGELRDAVQKHFVETFEKYNYAKDVVKTIAARVDAHGFRPDVVVTIVIDNQRYGIRIRCP